MLKKSCQLCYKSEITIIINNDNFITKVFLVGWIMFSSLQLFFFPTFESFQDY